MTDQVMAATGPAAVIVAARCPDFSPTAVLARTGKSLVLAGAYNDIPAVAKLLTDPAPLWRNKFAAEVHAYRVFAESPPPVRTPKLLASDPLAGLLVLERVQGSPVATVRHPQGQLPVAAADAVFAAVDGLTAWVPPSGAFDAVFDYPARFARYGPKGYGLLAEEVARRLEALHSQGLGWSFAHGDALLGNFLLDADSQQRCVLIDWEFAGLYLPRYDHAMLWTVLHADPRARSSILSGIEGSPPQERVAFWVNAAMTVTREIRMHRELLPGPMRQQRLADLEADWRAVDEELARLAV